MNLGPAAPEPFSAVRWQGKVPSIGHVRSKGRYVVHLQTHVI